METKRASLSAVIASGTGCEIDLRPHPEERALARVSKDGRESMRCVHPSRRLRSLSSGAHSRDPLASSQDEESFIRTLKGGR
jgi:hypothetical protein